MADQLTSVRLDADMLDTLRLLADAHATSVASEIRNAIAAYVGQQRTPELEQTLRASAQSQLQEREALIERLLTPH